ncbi:histone-lysine N-methyltransferase SETMAR [Trichonephila clavipes]|nr:histone-lysine N-methyltransferase SETMAR [Trichonephila clavipes]
MEVNKEKIRFFLQFFFDKDENASQVAEIANGVYGADTVTTNYVQFWFHRFRSGIFDVRDAPHTGRPVVENVDKITEIIEVDRHVSSRSIAQELKIDRKTVLSHLPKWYWARTRDNASHSPIPIPLGYRGHDPFLKRMVTGDKKWVTYYNIVRKRSWSKCDDQTRTNGHESSTVYLVELERNQLLGVASAWPNTKFRYLLSTTGPFEASD